VAEKDYLRQWMWRAAEFCGVEIITYVLMSNHFHVLVRVPVKEEADLQITDEILYERLAVLEGKERVDLLRQSEPTAKEEREMSRGKEITDEQRTQWQEEWERKRGRYIARMHDVSQFMKLLKERFGSWYNQTHQTYGTLWADRYKSLIVEDNPEALRAIALYIDLNPVRAKLVSDPRQYEWCGYAEAENGHRRVQRQLAYVTASCRDDASREVKQQAWEKEGRMMYRAWLFDEESRVEIPQGETKKRMPIPRERRTARQDEEPSRHVIAAKNDTQTNQGKTDEPSQEPKRWTELVRTRLRAMSQGLVLGRKEYVEKVYAQERGKFGVKRKIGAREMGGAVGLGWCVLKGQRTEKGNERGG
jgi:REP element-mobilizing transposase RayT